MNIHIPPLAAEPIGHIAGFTLTNSWLTGFLCMVGIVVFGYFFQSAVKKTSPHSASTGIVNVFEALLEQLYGYFDQVTGSREKTLKFTPFVGSIFLFILISNWIGLLPGIGSIGFWHGTEFIPYFRPANTDINMTLIMSVVSVVTSHILGILAIGLWNYFNKFIKIKDVVHALTHFNPIKLLTALIEFGVGIIESISEVAKVISLSLRLFGNIFAGEVLLVVLSSLAAYIVPLPFMGLELLVGIIQASVFAMLTLVYLTLATEPVAQH